LTTNFCPQDPFDLVADDLAASCHLLCIEKVAAENRQDAATFARLLEELLLRGCWFAFMVGAAQGWWADEQGGSVRVSAVDVGWCGAWQQPWLLWMGTLWAVAAAALA
jgi:hypothetical protein